MPIITCIFDAYGTLFDVAAAARNAAAEPDFTALADHWPAVARDWRLKQLQYTWLRATADRHANFEQVTADGLDWALENNSLDGDPLLRERLLALYWELDAYPEVPEVLATLTERGLTCAILSNGTPDMIAAAAHSAGIDGFLAAQLSVESVGVYKPHARVYELVETQFGCARDEVLFVSSNGWDAAGAAGFGFQTAWINRADEPQDRLYAAPHHTFASLTPLLELV
ncbi:haloacid dehalogenase type II [Pelagovum sp. HNIBRBA483]|uniref:haloacid dehalogenase type II n=1 Tax=Pelagovum sp. HNIBRBA483 TaxID=3233341 RepID=UPI0034A51E03